MFELYGYMLNQKKQAVSNLSHWILTFIIHKYRAAKEVS